MQLIKPTETYVMGSRAYGLDGPDSDEDLVTLLYPSRATYLQVQPNTQLARRQHGSNHTEIDILSFLRAVCHGDTVMVELAYLEKPPHVKLSSCVNYEAILNMSGFSYRALDQAKNEKRPLYTRRKLAAHAARCAHNAYELAAFGKMHLRKPEPLLNELYAIKFDSSTDWLSLAENLTFRYRTMLDAIPHNLRALNLTNKALSWDAAQQIFQEEIGE